MSIWERCTVNSGTRSKLYDIFRICHNAFRTVLIGAVSTLKFMSSNIYIVLPGKSFVLPVVVDGVFSMNELPDTKVWAVKTAFYSPLTEQPLSSFNTPLLKNSLEDIWKEVVEPFDIPIEGSEYYFYEDEETGEIRQGVNFYGEGKNRYFMLLADGGPLVRDVSIVYLFIWLLDKLGITSLVKKFVETVIMNMSNSIMKRKVALAYKTLVNLDSRFTDFVVVETISDGIEQVTLKDIGDRIGARLILR